jgi:hypothetical protein
MLRRLRCEAKRGNVTRQTTKKARKMRLDNLSSVIISRPPARGGQKIHGLNVTGTKKMWVKSSRVQLSLPTTKGIGKIVARTYSGWNKRQGNPKISVRIWTRAGHALFLGLRAFALPAEPFRALFWALNFALLRSRLRVFAPPRFRARIFVLVLSRS